jgi:hypothetical protein
LKLVNKGTLLDGCKIVIFSATIELENDKNCVVKLSVNSVRKALELAPLGKIYTYIYICIQYLYTRIYTFNYSNCNS